MKFYIFSEFGQNLVSTDSVSCLSNVRSGYNFSSLNYSSVFGCFTKQDKIVCFLFSGLSL